MDNGGKFKCTLQLLDRYKDALCRLEGRAVGDFLGITSNHVPHCHPVSTKDISRAAKKRMEYLRLDIDTCVQLYMGGQARLWGFFEHNIFHIIWLDATHEVYLCR